MGIKRTLSEYTIESGDSEVSFAIDMANHSISIICNKPPINLSVNYEDIESVKTVFNTMLTVLDFADLEFKSQKNNPK